MVASFAAAARQVLWPASLPARWALPTRSRPRPSCCRTPAPPASPSTARFTFPALQSSSRARYRRRPSRSPCSSSVPPIESLDQLPPSSVRCCRYLLLVAFFFCLLSFSGLISIVDLIVFVKVGRFTCLSLPAKLLVVAGDAVAAPCGMAVFAAGSYVSFFCN